MPVFRGIGAGGERRGVCPFGVSGTLPDGLNVNRHNRALHFYERMGMRKLREGDFPIGGGYWMNDYIMGLEIAGTDTDDCPGADGQRR